MRHTFSSGESHINFRAQCIIMTLVGGGTITNDVLNFRKVIELAGWKILSIEKDHLSIKKVVTNL